jgi:YesN/AraC family two-component response regulator
VAGSTVTAMNPVADRRTIATRSDSTPASPESQPTESERKNPSLHVLIVEDSKIVRERLISLINSLRLGIRLSVAEDGVAALRLFEERQPDVVLLDIALPELNGFDLLVQMKGKQASVIIIILTSYAYPEFRANALRLGADFFLSKSMEFERITHVLSSLVRP